MCGGARRHAGEQFSVDQREGTGDSPHREEDGVFGHQRERFHCSMLGASAAWYGEFADGEVCRESIVDDEGVVSVPTAPIKGTSSRFVIVLGFVNCD